VVFALADISGKGLPAALLMSNLHAMVRTLCATGARPDAMAGYLNDALHENLRGERFATLFLGRVDPDSGRLEYVNAGHSAGLLVRVDGDVVELVTGGRLLGPFPDSRFAAKTIDLRPGDLLLVTSDGVTEAESVDEEEFGERRLRDFLRANRGLPPAALAASLMEAVHEFTSPHPPGDDVTVLALRWT
jgi:sigma-B regulation protein RsbU (phosphoserine phosphatase)